MRYTNIDGMHVEVEGQYDCPFFKDAEFAKQECVYPGNSNLVCCSPFSVRCPLPRDVRVPDVCV